MEDFKTYKFSKEEVQHLYQLVDDQVFGLSPLAKNSSDIKERVERAKKLRAKLKTTL